MIKTLVTLIPKQERPKSITQFKPITLCNGVDKIIAKVCKSPKRVDDEISGSRSS